MVLQSASIIFNDSASQFNKDLTEFLRRNLETAIRKGQLSFQFKIAKPADLTGLRQMGVKRLPAMIINNRPFVGVPEIIAEIRSRVKNSKQIAPEKSEEEIIRDYQMAALGNVTKDEKGIFQIHDEEERDESKDLLGAFNREIQRRGGAAGHSQDTMNDMPRMTNPSRNVDREFDDADDYQPRQRNTYQTPERAPPRNDNLDNPHMADAMQSLRNISRNATGEDVTDDQMMAALLNRISGE
jgi:hypothetical protein